MSSSSTSAVTGALDAEALPRAAHGALARMTELALTTRDRSALIERVTAEAARALGAECSCVLELLPEGDALLIHGRVGWPDQIGPHAVPAGDGSLAAAALARDPADPLVIDDLATESRFSVPSFWQERGIASAVIASVPGRERPFGLLGVFTTSRRAFSGDDLERLLAISAVCGLGLARAAAEEERDDVLAREQAVSAQADALAVERERARVAGELHDRLSQILFSMSLQLNWCLAHVDGGSDVAAKLEHVRRETGAMMRVARGMVAELSGDGAAEPSAEERLRRLVHDFEALTGVAADLTQTGELSRLDAGTADVLHKTLQEALANVTKHAHACSVAIRVDVGDDRVSFEVADDGVGFPGGTDRAALLASARHFGLRQMVQRIESLGGRVGLVSMAPGVRLHGEVPISEARA